MFGSETRSAARFATVVRKRDRMFIPVVVSLLGRVDAAVEVAALPTQASHCHTVPFDPFCPLPLKPLKPKMNDMCKSSQS